MKSRIRWCVILAAVAVFVALGSRLNAEAPKVSAFAPAKDLESQVSKYLDRMDEGVKTEEEYRDAEGRIAKDANTMVLIALALGLHDQENQYQAAAPAMIKAAQDLGKAKSYAAAKAGVEALKKAAESKEGDASKLKWEKLASLPELMKQVPLVNNRLKRNSRTEKSFKTKSKDNAGDSAVLAVIAQGSMADTSAAKDDGQVKKWQEFCEQMRDISASINAAVREGKFDAADKGIRALSKNCDDCHDVFSPEAKKKAAEEK
jgi:CRISPR/Cas system-associated endonuclease Cas3-HD